MATFNSLRSMMPAILASGIATEFVSAPGRGKSSFVRQTKAEMEKLTGEPWGITTMMLATQSPTDLLGFMIPGERNGVRVSEYTLPPWMQTEDGKPLSAYRRGIIFLDEYGQGEVDVKRASAELLLNGQIGPHKKPDGWSVIAASNRAGDRSGVTKSLDFVINRRLEIHITDDIRSWEDWAFTAGVSPVAISFAAQNPQIVFSEGVPKDQGPWCTPRSLVMADNLLKHMVPEGSPYPEHASAIELVSGLIGKGAAAQMFAFIRLDHQMPKYEDIVRAPKTTPIPDTADARMLITHTLASRVTMDDCSPVVTYMERVPKEFSVSFARAVARRAPDLINHDAFGEWCDNNASLLAAVRL